MRNSDFYIQNMIESSLEQEDFSQIIILLDSLPSKNIRRALYLLSRIFPNKIEITENEFKFIKCILSKNIWVNIMKNLDIIKRRFPFGNRLFWYSHKYNMLLVV